MNQISAFDSLSLLEGGAWSSGVAAAIQWLTTARTRLAGLQKANSLGSRKNDASELLAQIDHNLSIIIKTEDSESVGAR